jgi:hypothetical protein
MLIIGFPIKNIAPRWGYKNLGDIDNYQYLTPLVQFPNSTKGAKYW